MILRQHALDDRRAQFVAGLPDDLLRRPDDVVAVVEHTVSAEIVCGHPLLPDNRDLSASRVSIVREERMESSIRAEAQLLRLEDEGLRPRSGQ